MIFICFLDLRSTPTEVWSQTKSYQSEPEKPNPTDFISFFAVVIYIYWKSLFFPNFESQAHCELRIRQQSYTPHPEIWPCYTFLHVYVIPFEKYLYYVLTDKIFTNKELELFQICQKSSSRLQIP